MVMYIVGLAIDYHKDHRVFWCDRKTDTIWSMDQNGKDVLRIVVSKG